MRHINWHTVAYITGACELCFSWGTFPPRAHYAFCTRSAFSTHAIITDNNLLIQQQKEQCVRCRSVNASSESACWARTRPTLMRARLCFVISWVRSARRQNNDPARTSVNTARPGTQRRITHWLIHHFISFSLACLFVGQHAAQWWK